MVLGSRDEAIPRVTTHLQLHKERAVKRLRMRTKTWSERMATLFLLLRASSSILKGFGGAGTAMEVAALLPESEKEQLWRCVRELVNNQMEASFILR
jgi:hypothetical protein